jgi:hypothetical protein
LKRIFPHVASLLLAACVLPGPAYAQTELPGSARARSAWERLVVDGDEARFRSELLSHPEDFEGLSVIADQPSAPTRAQEAVERVIADALLLRLEQLVDSAKSPDLLQPRLLKAKLGERWPRFRNLTVAVRSDRNTPSYFREPGKFSAFRVKGVYQQRGNVIWIDFAEPFYENVFLLQHELWHVAWSHSELNREVVRRTLSWLLQPGSVFSSHMGSVVLPPLAGYNTGLKVTQLALNDELSAVEQQALLFQLAGSRTPLGGREASSSARNWYRIYYGDDPARLAFGGPDGMVDSWSNRRDPFAKLQKIYVGQELVDYSEAEDLARQGIPRGAWKPAEPLRASCDVVATVRKSLAIFSGLWKYGVPFLVEPEGGPLGCEKPAGPDGPLGTEGGHPGTEGGHPTVEGVPSLEGPVYP